MGAKRLDQFVSGTTAWPPRGAWDSCADLSTLIPVGAETILGFDGSYNGDSTALVVVSCTPIPHIAVIDCWEKPPDARDEWAVDILDVEDAIRGACRRWQVREIVCDPFRWARTIQVLSDENLPVVEFPQTPARMVPATQRFHEAVLNHGLTHSGDPRLGRHLANAVLRLDSRGARLTKENKHSGRRIDFAVASVMAFDRASVQEVAYDILDSVL